METTTRPRMPPTARAAFRTPSPSGPTPRTSRARLGSRAWWENPRISAAPVSSMRAGSTRSFRIAVTKPTMLPHTEPDPVGAVSAGAEAGRSAAVPARKLTATPRYAAPRPKRAMDPPAPRAREPGREHARGHPHEEERERPHPERHADQERRVRQLEHEPAEHDDLAHHPNGVQDGREPEATKVAEAEEIALSAGHGLSVGEHDRPRTPRRCQDGVGYTRRR